MREALESAFAQQYDGEIQYVIVDDASPDDTWSVICEVVEQYSSTRDIVALRHAQNRGVTATVDTALSHATGDWIIEADSDDVQLPDRCVKTAELIARYPQAVLINLGQICVDAQGREYARRLPVSGASEHLAESAEERAALYMSRQPNAPVAHGGYGCSMAFKRSLYEKWGPLSMPDESRFVQDLPWELRGFMFGPVLWSNAIACKYRSHDSNLMNRTCHVRSFAEWKSHELRQSSYAGFEKNAFIRTKSDLCRAMEDNALSDWSQEDLAACVAMQESYILCHRLRHEWWGYSIFYRWWACLKYASQVPPRYKRWFRNRCLPFLLSVWARKWKKSAH